MKNIYKLLAVVLATLLLLCGCGNKEPEIDYDALVVAPLDITITDCISEEQISSVMAYPMTLLGVFEDGTQAIYQSDDGMYQVTINLKNESRAVFDNNAANQQTTLQEGIGETAYWSLETGELVAYANGYALGVSVLTATPGVDITSHTQQIAELILDRLQPTE